eukprot:Hpha_TRINITY_DN9438_c0_g1::TRINITY_DN9438_c0_g1_i1::g.139120::m.139120
MTQYVRVQRETKTWFIHVDPAHRVDYIIGEIARFEGRSPQDIRLLLGSDVLNPDTLCSRVPNGSQLYLVFRLGEAEWEHPCVKKPVYEEVPGQTRRIELPRSLVEFLDEMNPAAGQGRAPPPSEAPAVVSA